MTTTRKRLAHLEVDAFDVAQRLVDAKELVDLACRMTLDVSLVIAALQLGTDYAEEVEAARRDLKKIGDRLNALARFADDRDSLLASSQLHA